MSINIENYHFFDYLPNIAYFSMAPRLHRRRKGSPISTVIPGQGMAFYVPMRAVTFCVGTALRLIDKGEAA